jgi:ribosomal protein S27AE
MQTKSKLKTPEWILKGCDSPEVYEKTKGKGSEKKGGKTLKIRECPKCGSDDVGVVLVGNEDKKADKWECRKCKWTGKDINEKELNEEEFMKYLDEKGEAVA